jgi:hypothetical protein
MIEFDCPECGAPMEFKNSMAGRKVHCARCEGIIEVPDEDTKRPVGSSPRKDERPRRPARPPGEDVLSGTEFLLYALVCLAVPGINVLVTSLLYYSWKSTQPKRASQINALGFLIFGIHGVLFCLYRIYTSGAPQAQG